jgi:hydroxymethylpyrimidine pyrophosphatase-like HAD family hydrolase
LAQPENNRLLVAVDVDGTLLNTEFDDVLRPREIAALKAVRAAGHVLALCTGRNLNSTRALLQNSGWFPDDLPMVLLNGAVVWGDDPRRKLSSKELDSARVRRLVELFRQHDTVPMVYGTDDTGGHLHHETRPVNDVLGRYLDARRGSVGAVDVVDDLLAIEVPQALEVGTIDQKDRIMALSAAITREMGDVVKVINTRSLIGGGAYYWAEVFDRATDKGAGLRVLADFLGISLDSSVAIGDNYNDLDMFAVVRWSVAMAGSPDEVLQQADLVTGSADDGGAAVILERIAAGSWPATGQQMRKGDTA